MDIEQSGPHRTKLFFTQVIFPIGIFFQIFPDLEKKLLLSPGKFFFISTTEKKNFLNFFPDPVQKLDGKR